VRDYIHGVLSGAQTAGRLVRLAVLRHVRDLTEAPARGFVFEPRYAEEAIAFIETVCKHSAGKFAGQPFVLSPWQRFIVWNLFGWRREADGTRRYRRALIEIARKNGKSTFAAALSLLLLVFDHPAEPAAEVYCVATKEKQAQIVHREAKRMVSQSPALRRRLVLLQKSVDYPAQESFFQPLGSDSDSTDGLNTHAVIGDELHAWREKHRGLFEKLTTAGGARTQPLVCFITTAGDDLSRIWSEERDYAVRCLESALTGDTVSDQLFAFIAAIDLEDRPCPGCRKCQPPALRKSSGRNGSTTKLWPARIREHCDGSGRIAADDPFDERCWPKANPNLHVSVGLGYLREQAREAQQKPTSYNSFLRYHLNVRVSSTVKALPAALWEIGRQPVDAERGAVAYGAWDLGRSDDWAAVALVFPRDADTFHPDRGKMLDDTAAADSPPTANTPDDDTTYGIRAWCFTTEARADELCGDPYQGWIDRGLLTVHWGDEIDIAAIGDQIRELAATYQVLSWAYDPTFSMQLAQELHTKDGLPIFSFTQAARFYNEPLRRFLRDLRAGRIRHGGDPVLAWQAGNLSVKRNNRDEWFPDKIGSLGKIDGLVATLMAYSEALYAKNAARSAYEHHGVRVLQ
jgi:phage terminase large subunit-like protein